MATNADIRNVFGIAITTAYVMTLPYGTTYTRNMCQAFAQGFGMDISNGDSAYIYFQTNNPANVTTFSEYPFLSYLAQVQAITTANLPTLGTQQSNLMSIAAQSMIFAFAINPCMEMFDFQQLLGIVLSAVGSIVIGSPNLFPSYGEGANAIIYTPFTSTQVLQPLLQNDYSLVIKHLSQYPPQVEAALSNYNWYDVNSILHGPDLQIMKDVENYLMFFLILLIKI